MDCFLRVVDHNPVEHKAFYYMGKTLAMQGELEGAFHFFEYAMDLGSEDIQLYKDAIQAYYHAGHFALAVKTIEAGEKLAPGDPELRKLENRVRTAMFARKIKDAVNTCFLDKTRLFLSKQRCRVRRMILSKRN